MRSTAFKMFTVLLGSVLLLSTSSFTGPGKPAKPVKYSGYWFIQSGDELIQVKKVELPESAISKNAEGKMESFDMEAAKGKMNFKNEKNINGKQVDKHFFVATDADETAENATDMHSLISDKSTYWYSLAQCAIAFSNWKCYNMNTWWDYMEIYSCPVSSFICTCNFPSTGASTVVFMPTRTTYIIGSVVY